MRPLNFALSGFIYVSIACQRNIISYSYFVQRWADVYLSTFYWKCVSVCSPVSAPMMNRIGRCWSTAWEVLSRTKSIDVSQIQQTELRRCLSVVDLIALGKSFVEIFHDSAHALKPAARQSRINSTVAHARALLLASVRCSVSRLWRLWLAIIHHYAGHARALWKTEIFMPWIWCVAAAVSFDTKQLWQLPIVIRTEMGRCQKIRKEGSIKHRRPTDDCLNGRLDNISIGEVVNTIFLRFCDCQIEIDDLMFIRSATERNSEVSFNILKFKLRSLTILTNSQFKEIV